MSARSAKLYLSIILILLGMSAATYAAAQTGQNAPATITGCLQKGLESGGFFLIAGNDKHWEIYNSGNVTLADHVGQTVTITGTFPHRSTNQEQVSQPYEKKETGTRQHADFQVSGLQVVSQSCSK